jgi:hypothetical protein
MKSASLIGFALVALLATAVPASATSLNYPDFSSTAGLKLNGSAARSGNVLRLVPAQPNQAGSAFPFIRTSSREFHTHWAVEMHEGSRADGFTFAIQGAGSNALGGVGGGFGYFGIAPSLAFEFDIFQNPEVSDPNANHVGVDLDGSVTSFSTTNPGFDMYGRTLYGWIDATPNGSGFLMRLYLSDTDTKPSAPLFTVGGGQPLGAFVGGDLVWTGFTAGTGGLNANHDVKFWTLRDDGPRGSTSAKGSLVGTGSLTFASITDCDAPAATRPFIAEWNPGTGTKRFTKTAVRAETCEDNPSGYRSPAGFNEQRGSAVGTISGPGYQGPGSADFEYIDGGPGASAADRVRIVIRDNNGDVLYDSPLQQPGPYANTTGGVWTLPPASGAT